MNEIRINFLLTNTLTTLIYLKAKKQNNIVIK